MNNEYRRPRDASSVRQSHARTGSPRKPHSSSDKSKTFESRRPARGGSSSFSRSSERPARAPYRGQGGSHGGDRRGGTPFAHRTQNQKPRGRVRTTFDVSKFINKNPVQPTHVEAFTPTHTFGDFGLDHKIAQILEATDLTSPTHIQDEIIPHILKNRDVIGLSNTGTGKTAAFLIPLIDKTVRDLNHQTLILAPTRELAIQIETELKRLSHGLRMYATVCVGGTNIRPQIYGLKRKNHFIIGTPGRVIDLIERGVLRPASVNAVVLDEADRMLDMGFINDMRRILEDVPKGHQTLFFSATMSDAIKKLVSDFLQDPVTVSVKKQDITSSIEQDVIKYTHVHKFETLTKLLGESSMKRVLIFGAMKHSVEKLAQQLVVHGITAESIHGNKSHQQRQRSLKRFKDGQARVLVATDVAARGIHVDNVSHVINYDLPSTHEDYIHRIGRTGRGSEMGKALTFVEG
ncbi:MAG: DEAD/DEAH box helicase [Candidatus Kaiserbacteria bacterium]|nr:DEAD/DEAH box helicase [Candidatus Kaiserbacteria bacterium]